MENQNSCSQPQYNWEKDLMFSLHPNRLRVLLAVLLFNTNKQTNKRKTVTNRLYVASNRNPYLYPSHVTYLKIWLKIDQNGETEFM